MKTKMRKLAGRIVLLATVCLLLISLLASCGGGNKKTTLTLGSTLVPEEGASLKAEQLLAIAEMMVSVYDTDFDPREMLVAASRGYDMTIEGFDDSKIDPTENKGMNLEAAKNVIKAANDRADDDEKIGNEYEASLNEADVNTLIKAFRTKVDMTAGGGFFDPLLSAIGSVLRWMTNTLTFGSYLAGICLFAVLIEILMLPFAIKQQKNSIRQATLRPKEMAIRKKYAGRNDQVTQQKVSQEIQEMYQKEGFNPMSGCLPLLLSLVIIIPLYNLVIDPMKYMMGASSDLSAALHYFATASKAAGGLGIDLTSSNGTIELLSKLNVADVWEGMSNFAFYSNGQHCVGALQEMLGVNGELIPKFTILGLNFGLTPSLENPWLITVPVMTFVSYFASMKLSRKHSYQPVAQDQATGCSNKMMDFMMPAMSVWFTFMVPAAVGLYWVFKSLIGMVKSVIISKLMPLPVFTEADFKAAEREMAAKEKNRPVKKNSGGNPNVRSLHHIDDDEDELPPLPERPTTYVEDEEETPAASGEYLGDATIKEDDRPTPKKKDKKKKKGEETPADSDFASHDDDF